MSSKRPKILTKMNFLANYKGEKTVYNSKREKELTATKFKIHQKAIMKKHCTNLTINIEIVIYQKHKLRLQKRQNRRIY